MRKLLVLLLLCSAVCFARNRGAKHTFEVETGYPRGRSGYIIEYRVPLACGGANAPIQHAMANDCRWQSTSQTRPKKM